jgi:arylsulfatase A-like enzyme
VKAIVVLLDSLNRHYLPVYGNRWVRTPHIDRFAERSVVFDNHWVGSAPCIPARRDMLTGRLGFLERGWGGLEPYDVPFPRLLREAGIFCHMETDHYHYFHVGGENYHTPFSTWALHRGQESDAAVSLVSPPAEPEHLGTWKAQYASNRSAFTRAKDFPSPRTFLGAVDWLRTNQGRDDYLLWVEAFDPHEPFDTPPEYLELYGDHWQGPLYYWSGYERVDESDQANEHLRRRYAASLTMADEFFGRLIDEVERQGGLDDTLIILTTDHGHLLGEHGCTGKNLWHVWNELAHIPLVVHLPGGCHAGQHRSQLTQNIDLMPTLMEHFGVPFDLPIHGRSLVGILEEDGPNPREAVIYGWFGQTVNLTDGRHTYFRAAVREDNQPLYRHFLTPTGINLHDMPPPEFFAEAEIGRFLAHTDHPVIRSRVHRPRGPEHADTRLHDIRNDYGQAHNLAGSEIEESYRRLLVRIMNEVGAPPSQFERLGLKE